VVETPFDRPDTRSRPSLRRGEGRYGGSWERDVDRVRSMIEGRAHAASPSPGPRRWSSRRTGLSSPDSQSRLLGIGRLSSAAYPEAAAGGEVAPLNPSRTTHEPSTVPHPTGSSSSPRQRWPRRPGRYIRDAQGRRFGDGGISLIVGDDLEGRSGQVQEIGQDRHGYHPPRQTPR
jgi:hypothetical protein